MDPKPTRRVEKPRRSPRHSPAKRRATLVASSSSTKPASALENPQAHALAQTTSTQPPAPPTAPSANSAARPIATASNAAPNAAHSVNNAQLPSSPYLQNTTSFPVVDATQSFAPASRVKISEHTETRGYVRAARVNPIAERQRLLSEKDILIENEQQIILKKQSTMSTYTSLKANGEALKVKRANAFRSLSAARTERNADDVNFWRVQLNEVQRQITGVQEEIVAVQRQITGLQAEMVEVQKQRVELQKQMVEIQKQLTAQQSTELANIAAWGWTKCDRLAKFAEELCTTEVVQYGEGVEALHLSCGLDDDSTVSPTLVTRRHTRGICEAMLTALEAEAPPVRVIMTGAPGIGKTRSLTYLLRLLLRRREKVMYANRKSGKYILFEPRANGFYSVELCASSSPDPVLMMGASDFVLVDPAETGNDVHYTNGKLALAASTNRDHYHNWEKDGAKYFYMPPCSESEARVIRTVLNVELDNAVLHSRFMYAGGAMRYLFDYDKFRGQVLSMHHSRMALSRESVLRVLNGNPAKEVEGRTKHLSTLFVAYDLKDGVEQRSWAEGGDDGTGDSLQGVQVDYKQAAVVFASYFAKLIMIRHMFETAFQEIVQNSDRRKASYYGVTFGDLALARIMLGGTFSTKCLDQRREVRNIVLKQTPLLFVSSRDAMLAKITERTVRARSREHLVEPTLFVAPKDFAVIDGIDSENRYFNVILVLNHRLSESGLQSILDCQPSSNDVVDLYWCVPETVTFRDCRKQHKHSSRRVRQHVLWIPKRLSFELLVTSRLSETVALAIEHCE